MKNQEGFKIGNQSQVNELRSITHFPIIFPDNYLVKLFMMLTLKTQFSKYFSKIGLFGGFSGFHTIYLVDKINWEK
jgi:hypothetical protein